MFDTWQWLMARTTQLALLLPTELTGGVCRTPLWRKLAVGATTSLYMKAMALACIPAPITPIKTMSISIWTKGQELYLLFSTCVLCIHQHTETASCSWQHKAAKGLTPFPTGRVWKWSQIPAEERESKKVSLLSCGIARLRQAPEPVVLKCYDISLVLILTSLQCHTWFCSHLAVHMQGEGRTYTTICTISKMNSIFGIRQS